MESDFYLTKLRQIPIDVPLMDIYMASAPICFRKIGMKLGEIYDRLTTMVQMKHKLSKAWHLLPMKLGMPARSKTGRLLASLTSKPEALFLAGELLQMDGRYQRHGDLRTSL